MDDPKYRLPMYSSMPLEERQREYSPSSAIGGNYVPYIEQYALKSAQAYTDCCNVKTVSYGEQATQSFDLALPDSNTRAPILMFIHGGYWQALSKRESFFGAKELVERGIAYAALDYTLAPNASLAQILGECELALNTLSQNAPDLGIDASQIYVAGSSAGAHLSAMCCHSPNINVRPAGVVLLSGIFDLEPFVDISDNEAVGLNLAQAKQLSPLLLPTTNYPDTIVSWGEHETSEFKRQSMAMGDKLSTTGRRVEIFESPSRNHFDVVHDLVDLNTPLGKQLQSLISR